MLPITQFPRRFPTAHKRVLLAAARAAAAASVGRAPSAAAAAFAAPLRRSASTRLASSLSARAGSSSPREELKPAPLPRSSPAALSPRGHVRDVQTQAARAQGLASTAASAVDDDHLDDHLDDHFDDHDDSYLYGPRADDWFTTAPRHPRRDPAFPGKDPATGRLHSVAMPHLATCSRQHMLDYLDNTWALTDALFATLQGARAFTTPPPHQLRHPLIFYYGHPTCFFINKLVVSGLVDAPLNPYYEHVFEVGVDEMRWDDMSKNEMHWPSVADVTAYRRQVYAIVRELIETHEGLAPGHAPIDEASPLWALCMALEHDRIHLETSSMLMLEHPLALFRKSDLLPDYHASASRARTSKRPVAGVDYPVNELLPVPAATVAVGKPRDFPTFGWDNEYGHKLVDVPACEASKFLISNGEFFEFVASGGYLEPSYWTALGWEWRCFRNTKWPQFWVPDGPSGSHQYKLRALFDVIDMQWDWPAQVNYHEAKAFCKWKNARDGNKERVVYHLTTEPIHQLLRDDKDRAADATRDDVLAVRTKMADEHGKNLNLSHLSFSPVDALAPTAGGFHDVFGNAWEWCEDVFNALPGFQLHKYYDDFSAPCFDGEHQVIMGGSFISTGDNGASKFARYHFRPHFFQHAGFRVVAQPVDAATQSYTLATTCVNAPGPYATANPYRASAQVSLVEGKSSGLNHGGDHTALFDEIYRKSESVLENFVQAIREGDDCAGVGGAAGATMLVRNGASGALKLKDQLQHGDVMVVVSPDDDAPQLEAQLAGEFALVHRGAVPVFTKESETEARVAIHAATAWKKH